ncbi:hypothetical protein [Mycolicibacterium setense]|nr:hypothetical protein [Mycolicibacterium setense]
MNRGLRVLGYGVRAWSTEQVRKDPPVGRQETVEIDGGRSGAE